MQILIRSKTGIMLTEALVAVATLTIAIIALGTIINNSLSTLTVSRDYLIAENLLVEAEEVVEIVRDSNWLIVPSKKECWLTLDPLTNIGRELDQINCGPFDTNSNYIPVFENNHWLLKNNGLAALNLSPQNAETLNQYRILLRQTGNLTEYKQGIDSNEKSKFYRSINFSDPTDGEVANFEVKIQWLDGQKARTIKATVVLNNQL